MYSDSTSRICHLNRILILIGVVGGTNIGNGLHSLSVNLRGGDAASLVLCLASFGVGLLLALGCLKLFAARRELKRQQELFE